MDLNSQPTASSEWFDPEEAECQWAAVASEADGGQSVTTAELKSSDAVDGGVAYSLELRDYTFANGAWKFEKMDTVPPGDAAETLTALRPAAHRIDPDLLYEARLLHRAGEEPMRPRPLTKAEIRETGGLAQVKALLRPSLLRRGSAIAMERGAGESAAKVAMGVHSILNDREAFDKMARRALAASPGSTPEAYRAYRERAQQRQAERQPHQARGGHATRPQRADATVTPRAAHDGLDLDAEGRDAREASGAMGERAQQVDGRQY